MKLIEIAIGWYNYAHGGSYIKNLMEKRLSICDGCPNKKQLSATGVIIVKLINEEGSMFQCGLCGCPLSALTANPASACKDNKWKPAGEESFF